MQEPQPLCHQLGREKIDARHIAARPGEARDKTKLDRVFGDGEDDRNRRGRRLGRECRRGAAERDNHGDLTANQFGRQRRQPIELVLRPAIFDRYVLALDVARVLQTLAEMRADGPQTASGDTAWRNPITGIAGCCARAASGHAAAAPPSSVMNSRRLHSITSSARASSVGGISRPIALAVLRLMTSSCFTGACTGRSAGFSPLRMRST